MTETTVSNNKPEESGATPSRAAGLFLSERYEEAEKAYDELLKSDTDNMDWWLNRMLCRSKIKAPDAAFFDEMLKRVNRLPAEGYLCLAEVLKQLGRESEALMFVNRALEKNPDNVTACLLKVQLLDTLEKPEELFAFLSPVFDRLKSDERILCAGAYYALLFWNTRQADYLLKKALKINKPALLHDKMFYVCLNVANRNDSICRYAADALKDDDQSAFLYYVLAEALAVSGQFQQAADAYASLAALTELSDETKLRQVNVLSALNRLADALQVLERVSSYSEYLFITLRGILIKAAASDEFEVIKTRLRSWREQTANPEIIYLCDTVLNPDRTEDVPPAVQSLIADETIIDALSLTGDVEQYFGADLLDKALEKLKIRSGKSMEVLDAGCIAGHLGEVIMPFSRPKGRLTGIDISSVALDFADNRQIYDELIESDIVSYCLENKNRFDLIIDWNNRLSGRCDLTPVFNAVKQALRPNGTFVFAVFGDNSGKPHTFMSDGCFAHSVHFVKQCAAAGGLSVIYQKDALMAEPEDKPAVNVSLFAVQKSA